jgi:RNA polymerase sigma-70 factor (ECF subfamily)
VIPAGQFICYDERRWEDCMVELDAARNWTVVSGGRKHNASDSDSVLLAQGRSGDQGALEALLSRHEPELLKLCRGVLGRKDDADDAVQEAFLRALRSLHRFRGESSVRTWLYRVAVNVCLEWRRSRSFSHERLPDESAAHHPSPEASTLLRMQLSDALSRLLPRQRIVILLKEAHGFSVAEIAVAMGWSSARVQNELYRARKALAAWRASEDEREKREERR